MKKKIFSSIFIVSVSLIVFITVIVTSTYYNLNNESQIKILKEESQLVINGVELNGESFFDSLVLDSYRITWIKNDGSVIYDSASNEELENHLEREEVKDAINNGYGQSIRFSNTIMKESIYVAYKINDGSIIRLACVQNSVFSLIVSNLYPLYFIAFIVLVIAIVLAYILSKKIIDPLNNLDLDNINKEKIYPEIEPLLTKIERQRNQLISDKTEIEKAFLMRQDFTANVTHEMKTPLHVIAGYSELMKEGLVKPTEIKEFSTKIYCESYRMTKLVDDILELARLDNDILDEDKKKISLDFIANNVIDSLSSVASERNICIHANLKSVELIGVAEIIHSMIYNLINNAIKYNKENGEIDVVVEYEGYSPVITVTDTGIGIPSDQINRIFERFYRVDKSRSREIGGTGLGLSIVKHAAIVHNARVEVESTLGVGSTFKVIF